MTNNSQRSLLVDKILGKIRSGQIKMRSKSHFILKTVFIFLSVIVVALFTLFLISFIIFALRASGIWFMPSFGFRGMGIFFSSLPWLLILTAILLIVILEILVKRFSFTYRRPILYSIVVIVILVLLGSFILDQTRFHSGLFGRAQDRRLPMIGQTYRDYGMAEFQNVYPGTVTEITDSGFLIKMRDGQVLTVVVTSKIRFPSKISVKKNDTVVVLGECDNDTIQAFGIRKITDDLRVFPSNRPELVP